jgi:predicted acetyltransferase
MNSIKHSSLKIGRLDLSLNVENQVSEDKQDLVVTFLQKQLNKEVSDFLDFKSKNDFVERVRLSEDIYTASGGHYSGLVNKRTKISQVIYNKSQQLDYKLLKASRKKNFSSLMLQRLNASKDNFKGIWRLEVQAYGYKAIQKAVNSYDKIMKKLSKLLFIVIKLVNKIDMREFVILKQFGEESREFCFWFNDINKEYSKPPLISVT